MISGLYSGVFKRQFKGLKISEKDLLMIRSLNVVIIVLLISMELFAGRVINAKGGSRTQVLDAINQTSIGDTVFIPAGTYSFDGGISMKAGITIMGAGQDKTILKKSGNTGPYTFTVDGSNGERVRITGMTIIGINPTMSPGIKIVKGCKDFRIDHITFKNCYDRAIEVHDNSTGVIDHNIFLDNELTDVVVFGDGDGTWRKAYKLGGPDAVFIEDNYFEQKSPKNPGMAHHVASNNGSKYVFRYNTMVDGYMNAQAIDVHGNKFYWPRGSRSYEIYNNKLTATHRWLGLRIRGGDGVIYNNELGGDLTYPIDLMHEGRDGDGNCSYPCVDQIRELYMWGNTYNGKVSPVKVRHPELLKENRDFFLKEKPGYVPYQYPHPLTKEVAENPTSVIRTLTVDKNSKIGISSMTAKSGDEVHIRYTIPGSNRDAVNVELRVFNVSGQMVNTIFASRKSAGAHEYVWNARDGKGNRLSSGIYTLELRADGMTATSKIMMSR